MLNAEFCADLNGTASWFLRFVRVIVTRRAAFCRCVQQREGVYVVATSNFYRRLTVVHYGYVFRRVPRVRRHIPGRNNRGHASGYI